ncbi:hypothetical protein ON010_g1636 [Phytophthora cinnamomi]|nr:hypothetical protein ON010_g1636 [Phytophthora cinnamomi]
MRSQPARPPPSDESSSGATATTSTTCIAHRAEIKISTPWAASCALEIVDARITGDLVKSRPPSRPRRLVLPTPCLRPAAARRLVSAGAPRRTSTLPVERARRAVQAAVAETLTVPLVITVAPSAMYEPEYAATQQDFARTNFRRRARASERAERASRG